MASAMYRHIEYWRQADTLRHVRPLREAVEEMVEQDSSPFRPPSLLLLLRRFVARRLLWLVRVVFNTPVFFENDARELALVSARTRALLTRLLREGIITKWRWHALVPGVPKLAIAVLSIGTVRLPNGAQVTLKGSAGCGAGATYDEALIPALGELLERHACMQWGQHTLATGSYTTLRRHGACDPCMFQLYNEQQVAHPAFPGGRVDAATQLRFLQARELVSDKHVLIPAQSVLMFGQRLFPQEPLLQETTSNAAAAATTFDRALYGAICEAIERDGFLMFWLSRIAPPRISLASLPLSAPARARVQWLQEHVGEFAVLDCTTEIGVPTLVGVVADRHRTPFVSVHAAAGLEPQRVAEKLITDTIQHLHTHRRAPENAPAASSLKTIDSRAHYWHRPERVADMQFFLSGPEVAFHAAGYKACRLSAGGMLPIATLRTLLSEAAIACFFVDITSAVARQAGLRVARAVMPQLVPMYFNEAFPHLGVARLASVPRRLGYETPQAHEGTHNLVPHPFL